MALGRALKRASGIFLEGETFTSRDAPSMFQLDANSVGLDYSKRQVAGLPDVYRAVNFLTGVAGQLPLRAQMIKTEKIVGNELFRKPSDNSQFTAFEWKEYELRSRLLFGNSYALKGGSTPKSPWPATLYPIHPERVAPYGIYKNGRLIDVKYLINRAFGENAQLPGTTEELLDVDTNLFMWVDRREMFHVPGQSFDGVQGISPIEACMLSLSLEMALEESGARFYGRGSMMSGFLSTDRRLTFEDAQAVKSRWQQSVGGVHNSHEVAVLGMGMKFEPITIKPQEAQFIEMRRFGVEQVARIFGVPPFALMDSGANSVYGSSIEQQLNSLEIFSLSYWLRSFEERATLELLPSTQEARFDLEPLTRASVKDLAGAISILRTASVISQDEARAKLRLPPMGTPESEDPNTPLAQTAPADQPGGNDGTQGGGEDSDLGGTDPASGVQDVVNGTDDVQ